MHTAPANVAFESADPVFATPTATGRPVAAPAGDLRTEPSVASACHRIQRRIRALQLEIETGRKHNPNALGSAGDIWTSHLGRVVEVRISLGGATVTGSHGSWTSAERLPRHGDARRLALIELESTLRAIETNTLAELRAKRSVDAAKPAPLPATAVEFLDWTDAVVAA